MLRWVALGLLLAVSLILESTLFRWLAFWQFQPDLVLIAVVFFALFSGSSGGAFFGFLGGLAQDALTGQFLGLNACSKMIVGLSVAQLERKVYKEYPFIPMLVVFIFSLLNQVLVYLLAAMFVTQPPLALVFFKIILPAAGYNSLISGFTYSRFFRSITKGWLQPSEL